jgi:hypothetical protein
MAERKTRQRPVFNGNALTSQSQTRAELIASAPLATLSCKPRGEFLRATRYEPDLRVALQTGNARCVTAVHFQFDSFAGPARGGSCWPITPRSRPTTWRRRQSKFVPLHEPLCKKWKDCPNTFPVISKCRGTRNLGRAARMPLLWETRPSQSGSPTARLSVLNPHARARGVIG